ncbi:MAG: hypothetical protein IJ744_05880 [Lachnospiraceae bacterium]|nr:hypothetical protein [Lachnospiraceae bacterium]
MPFVVIIIIVLILFLVLKKKNESGQTASSTKNTANSSSALIPPMPDEEPFPNTVQVHWRWYPPHGVLEHLTLFAVIGEGISLADETPGQTQIRYTSVMQGKSVRLSLTPFRKVVNGYSDNYAGQYLIRLSKGEPSKEYFLQRSLYNKDDDALELYFDAPTDPYERTRLSSPASFAEFVRKYSPHILASDQTPAGDMAFSFVKHRMFQRFVSETISATAIVAISDKPILAVAKGAWCKPETCLEYLRLFAVLGELGATQQPGAPANFGRSLSWWREGSTVNLFMDLAEELIDMTKGTVVGQYFSDLYRMHESPGANALQLTFDISQDLEATQLFRRGMNVYTYIPGSTSQHLLSSTRVRASRSLPRGSGYCSSV